MKRCMIRCMQIGEGTFSYGIPDAFRITTKNDSPNYSTCNILVGKFQLSEEQKRDELRCNGVIWTSDDAGTVQIGRTA